MTEVIIYQAYTPEAQPGVGYLVMPEKPKARRLNISQILSKLSIILVAFTLLILTITYVPAILGFVRQINLSEEEATGVTQSQTATRSAYQPPFDPKLSKENRLIIPTIGVNTKIEEATYESHESALREGVWRVSDFGQPSSNTMPTILVAHRFGYLAWTNLYRRYNSFYNLPKLNVGDTVEVDWSQRRYIYEIYAAEEGTEISDYSADLVLYTCVDLTGNQRIFRYARLLSI
jgi:sortase (surface protein transpeptidase)